MTVAISTLCKREAYNYFSRPVWELPANGPRRAVVADCMKSVDSCLAGTL